MVAENPDSSRTAGISSWLRRFAGPLPAIGSVSIVVAVLLVVFNLFGLPYPGMYDNFLIIVSIAVNALIVWYAWTRVSTAA